MKYRIETYGVDEIIFRTYVYEVDAETKEEAISIVKGGDIDYVDIAPAEDKDYVLFTPLVLKQWTEDDLKPKITKIEVVPDNNDMIVDRIKTQIKNLTELLNQLTQ
jgi:hypothetical protein